jgi:hypothetical protein
VPTDGAAHENPAVSTRLGLRDSDFEELASFVEMSNAVAALVERVGNLSCVLDEVKGDIKGNLVDPKAFDDLSRRVDWLERKMLYAIGAVGALNLILYVVASRLVHLSWGL